MFLKSNKAHVARRQVNQTLDFKTTDSQHCFLFKYDHLISLILINLLPPQCSFHLQLPLPIQWTTLSVFQLCGFTRTLYMAVLYLSLSLCCVSAHCCTEGRHVGNFSSVLKLILTACLYLSIPSVCLFGGRGQ